MALGIDNSWKGTGQANNVTTLSSASITTARANELLVVFMGSDQASITNGTFTIVGTGGLSWSAVTVANSSTTGAAGQHGAAGVAWAWASSQVVGQTIGIRITSTSLTPTWLLVVAFTGAISAGLGATAIAGNTTGVPTKSLITTASNSWVWGTIWDWTSNATPATPGNQTQRDIWNDAGGGDAGWVQYVTIPTASSGASVTINNTSPTTDEWNLAMVEILADNSSANISNIYPSDMTPGLCVTWR